MPEYSGAVGYLHIEAFEVTTKQTHTSEDLPNKNPAHSRVFGELHHHVLPLATLISKSLVISFASVPHAQLKQHCQVAHVNPDTSVWVLKQMSLRFWVDAAGNAPAMNLATSVDTSFQGFQERIAYA
jgi:hypothetical protein